ncbi:MAG: hypothetical protein GX076_00940, partial [Clostridiales bacterium]|nr:hypothetical protein [Clostridiales bacterium]
MKFISKIHSYLVLILAIVLISCANGSEKDVLIVNAADYGFDENDSTIALQAAIDSGAKKVIVPNMGKDWIISRTITLVSNQTICFEPGVVISAKKGAFKGTKESLFQATNKSNIVLFGYNATLKMQKQDYMGSEYTKGEWRHILALRSCTNIKVLGLTL